MAGQRTYEQWLTIPDVERALRMAREFVVRERDEQFVMTLRANLGRDCIESPLEAVFYGWWIALLHANHVGDEEFVILKPQYELQCAGRSYRLDFAFIPSDHMVEQCAKFNVPQPLTAVELDGHAFHEKTKEQVAYRNRRDRDLQAAGWCALHYSWSEMMHYPERCIQEAYNAAMRNLWATHWQIADIQYPNWQQKAGSPQAQAETE